MGRRLPPPPTTPRRRLRLAMDNDGPAGQPEPSDEAVNTFYCQSAVRTTQLIFGLHRAGWPLETLRNYDGSWVEWSHLAKDDDILVAG